MTHNIPDYQKYLNQVEPYYTTNTKTKYHTFEHHIKDMMQTYLLGRVEFLQHYPDLNEEDLVKAICFHDIVFTPGDNDNERLSADVFLHHYPGEIAVADAIISTEVSNTTYKNPLEMILHDLDWMGFSSYAHMTENEDLIFIEAKNATNCCYEAFLIGSVSFYNRIKDRDIYVTKMYSNLNSIAKLNIQTRIDHIKQNSLKGNK